MSIRTFTLIVLGVIIYIAILLFSGLLTTCAYYWLYFLVNASNIITLTAHNWQNWKIVFLSCYCHKIYRVEAVGLKILIMLENYSFCEYVKFGAISWKNQYFANNCLIKFESENSFARIQLQLSSSKQIPYLSNRFLVKYSFSVPNLLFLKDRFLKKLFLKRAKPVAFYSQNYRLNSFFYSNWKQFQVFKRA